MLKPDDVYFRYEKLTHVLKSLAQLHPQKARMSSIGKTGEGRDIWLMTVTDYEDHAPEDRPALWIDGNTHASELAGCQACLHLLEELTSKTAPPRIQELLRQMTFYIVPRVSPDGAEHVLEKRRMVRSTPLEFPGDQPFENFEMKDLDGDGEVLMMRVRDASGNFKVSPLDARLMIPREPWDSSDEDGPFYHLFVEGEFKNFDGYTRRQVVEQRYDLNRQSPADFSPKEYGAGPLPMYLPEARAIAQAVVDRPNIVTCVTYHTYGGVLLRPSSLKPDSDLPTADLEVFKTMGEIGEKLTGYKPYSIYHGFRYDPKSVTTGAWDDWHYHHRGLYSWTPEIWNLTAQAGIKYDQALQLYQNPGPENLVKTLKWCDENLPQGTYFKDWAPFQHAQLGEIEIGGWRTLFTWSNPPPSHLKPELEKLTQWVLKLADMAPRLAIQKVDVKPVGDDLFVVRIQVSNHGFLPTHVSEVATSLKVYKTPTASLHVSPGQTLIQGKAQTEIKHLKGRSTDLPWVSPIYGSRIENDHEDHFTYTVRGRGVLRFEASYHGGGRVQAQIEL